MNIKKLFFFFAFIFTLAFFAGNISQVNAVSTSSSVTINIIPDSCGPGSGTEPKLTEPTGTSACSVGTLNSSSPANTTTSGLQAWNWSCGTVTSCTAPLFGCRLSYDSNYVLSQYGETGPNNNWGCASSCLNGGTDYPTCTAPIVYHTVSFNGNGSTGGSTASQSIAENTSAGLRSNGFTRTGYTFASWNIFANGSGKSYFDNESYAMGTTDATLYAQWTAVAVPTCGSGNGTTPQELEPTGSFACSVGTLNSSSPADTTTSGFQAWNWSCGTVTCSAPQYGCTTVNDINYNPTGPNNTWGCADKCSITTDTNYNTAVCSNVCANGGTDYPTCTAPITGSCGPGSGTEPKLTEPTGTSACSVGTLNSSSPTNTTTTWKWSCGTVNTCAAPKYGCNVSTDSNYSATGANNDWNCALTCANGGTDYPTCTAPVVSPSGSITAGNCTIAIGSSTCNSTLNWSTSNLTANPTEVTRNNPSVSVSTATSGTNVSKSINYGTSTFFLYHNSVSLSQNDAVASCNSTTSNWDGSKCVANVIATPIWSSWSPRSNTCLFSGNQTRSCIDSSTGLVIDDNECAADSEGTITTKPYTNLAEDCPVIENITASLTIPYNSRVKFDWIPQNIISPCSCSFIEPISGKIGEKCSGTITNESYQSSSLKKDTNFTITCSGKFGLYDEGTVDVIVLPINVDYTEI